MVRGVRLDRDPARSTTGCRTCWSRRRRSASRCSPRARAGWPTCSRTAAPRCCSTPATRPAARGRCSARRASTRRGGCEMGAACRRAGRDRARRASSRSRATSRRSPRRARAAARARVILYYALGGGLGHLTRARKVLDGARADATRDAAHRLALRARPARDRRAAACVRVPRRARPRPRALPRAGCAGTLAELRPDELIVDSFPGGILGELCGMDAAAGAARRRAACAGRPTRSGSTGPLPALRRDLRSSSRWRTTTPGADGPLEPLTLPGRVAGRAAGRRAALARRPLRPGARARRAARARRGRAADRRRQPAAARAAAGARAVARRLSRRAASRRTPSGSSPPPAST